jgi:TolA-binding protein
MVRKHSLKTTPFLFAITTAALFASTSLVYAIDPNVSVAIQSANQQAVAQAQNTQERITRIEDQIVRMNEEVIALREQKIQAQLELQSTKELR